MCNIFIGAKFVNGGQTDILQFDEPFLDQSLVMLCDLDCAKIGSATMIAGHFTVVVQQLLELVVERVSRGVRCHLHIQQNIIHNFSNQHKKTCNSHNRRETWKKLRFWIGFIRSDVEFILIKRIIT